MLTLLTQCCGYYAPKAEALLDLVFPNPLPIGFSLEEAKEFLLEATPTIPLRRLHAIATFLDPHAYQEFSPTTLQACLSGFKKFPAGLQECEHFDHLVTLLPPETPWTFSPP